MIRGLVIAAPASAQGKTTVTLGLLRALARAGHDVASAKSGPDFIDPGFHAAATGKPCINLDSWAADGAQLRARLAMQTAALVIIEGAMGLFDGAAGQPPGGAGSAQALAAALDLPVVLVIDIARMGQSVAALVEGFSRCSSRLAGVILNSAGSARHEAIARSALAGVCPVLGVLPAMDGLATPSRHLGLVQAGERADLEAFLDRAADAVIAGCDLAALAGMAGNAAPPDGPPRRLSPPGQRIAVARDRAFGFAYRHILEPPDKTADAVFLPGGYPELHAGKLAGAQGFRAGMQAATRRGALIYGECGGYMVLGECLTDADGARHPMLGLLRLETSFAERRRHLGYRVLTPLGGPWSGVLRGHEFHYSSVLKAEGDPLFAMADAEGHDLGETGLRNGRVMGSFAHVIEAAPPSEPGATLLSD